MKKKTIFILILIIIAIGVYWIMHVFTKEDTPSPQSNTDVVTSNTSKNDEAQPTSLLVQNGTTVETRYQPPVGYQRTTLSNDSFGTFLRNQKLKPYGEKVLYYNGSKKPSQGVYDSVFDVTIGKQDLHQCADAIMLLRAEYLYAHKRYDEIQFHFVSGFLAEYSKWMNGNRIQVNGNQVSWVKKAEPSSSYDSFRSFMNVVFTYAGTASLEKELKTVSLMDMQVSDVFIKGGSPGHAVIVIDMAENSKSEKVYMLAQSYMPAQQTQILVNNNDSKISPWYTLEDIRSISTPEWLFDSSQLKRFP